MISGFPWNSHLSTSFIMISTLFFAEEEMEGRLDVSPFHHFSSILS